MVSTSVVLFGTRFPSRWIQQIPAFSPSLPFSPTLLNIGLVSGSLSTHTSAVPQKITFRSRSKFVFLAVICSMSSIRKFGSLPIALLARASRA